MTAPAGYAFFSTNSGAITLTVTPLVAQVFTLSNTCTNSNGQITINVEIPPMVGMTVSLPPVLVSGNTVGSAGNTLVITGVSTSALAEGYSVSGPGIPSGSTITFIQGNSITITAPFGSDFDTSARENYPDGDLAHQHHRRSHLDQLDRFGQSYHSSGQQSQLDPGTGDPQQSTDLETLVNYAGSYEIQDLKKWSVWRTFCREAPAPTRSTGRRTKTPG